MKKNLLIFTLICLSICAYGQSERIESKLVSDAFEKNYNSENYEAIFSMFGPEMQKALPLDKTKEFLKGVKAQAGKITNRQFIKYENGTSASYKSNFEKAIFTINISIDSQSKINGFYIKPYIADNSPKMDQNTTKLILPFNGVWTIIWGGDTKELNYHVENQAQKNAFDIIISNENGLSYKSNGQNNEDFYAFGKDIIAPCDGEIVLAVDGIKDNKPREMNPIYVPGNTVILKTAKNEYLFFAHFKQQSIKVKEGQKVVKGQLLGLCGNSGNSSEPHLHFHIQNVENMNIATGVKCFFENIMVSGKLKNNYSPIKNEKISNE